MILDTDGVSNAFVSFKSNRATANVVYSCKHYVVFCPKYRRKVLTPAIEGRLKEFIRKVDMAAKSELIEMAVMPDHVHLLRGCDL